MLTLSFLLLINFSNSTNLKAASVTDLKKKRKIVVIDEGSANGFEKGLKVCFFRNMDKPKAACGRVVKVAKKKSFIRTHRRFSKVKRGYYAQIKQGTNSKATETRLNSINEGSIATNDSYSKDLSKLNPKEATENFKVHNYKLGFLFLPNIAGETPATYNLLKYNGALQQEGGSLWTNKGKYSSIASDSIVNSFGLEVEFIDLQLSIGGRYKSFNNYEISSDYSLVDVNLHVNSSSSASAVGLYFVYGFSLSNHLSLSFGLDIDRTTVSLDAYRYDDLSSEKHNILSAKANNSILSARMQSQYEQYYDPIGFHIGANFILPITSISSSCAATPGI